MVADVCQAQLVNRYVDAGGSVSLDGTNWSEAWPSPQSALDTVGSNTNWRVLVAEGTYHPTLRRNASDPPSVTFHIAVPIKLYGGFEAGVGDDPPDANHHEHPTILSGDIGTPATVTDNAYHVVVLRRVGSSTVLDGFVIRDGFADGTGSVPEWGDWGGGILVANWASDWESSYSPVQPVIQNCVIESNLARNRGGGIAAFGDTSLGEELLLESEPILRSCTIRGNVADSGAVNGPAWGGGFYTNTRGNLASCLLVGNQARRDGGAVFAEIGATVSLHGCTVTGNSLLPFVQDLGGGLCPTRTAGVLTGDSTQHGARPASNIINCIIWDNRDDPAQQATFVQEQIWTSSYPCESEVDDLLDVTNIYRSCIQDFPSSTQASANGIITTDPLFVDPASDDFRLQYGSPCIDAGDVNAVAAQTWDDFPLDSYDVDHDGVRDGTGGSGTEFAPDLRPLDRVHPPAIDMGAYEFRCRYDLDGDGAIGASDLAILLGAWGTCSGWCQAVYDGSGAVGAPDLATLLGLWGSTAGCESDMPLPYTGSGFMAMAMAAESGEGSEASGLAPPDLGSLYGFETIEAFAQWLGSLTPSQRAAVLSLLEGGEL